MWSDEARTHGHHSQPVATYYSSVFIAASWTGCLTMCSLSHTGYSMSELMALLIQLLLSPTVSLLQHTYFCCFSWMYSWVHR